MNIKSRFNSCTFAQQLNRWKMKINSVEGTREG